MARIGESLGFSDNPLYRTLSSNRNAITNFGAGLASGGWGGAAQGLANGAGIDDYRAEQGAEKAAKAAELKSTADWLNSQGYTDLVPLVEAGQGGAAMSEAFKRMQPGYGAGPAPIEVGGVLLDPTTFQPIYDGREAPKPIEINGQLVDPTTREVIGDYRTPDQTGVKPPTDAQRKAASLYTVVAPDAELLLGNGTTPGVFEDLGDGGSQAWNGIGVAGVNPLAGLASSDFQSAKDAVTNIAQSYLYAMSGAAAPAEEVKKIADLVTPNPGDSVERKAEKRRRLESYVQAIQNSTIQPPASAGGGWEVIGVTQ